MTFRLNVLFFLAVCLLPACVGKKKYVEAVGKQLSAQERESQLQKRLDNTNTQLRQVVRENGLLESRISQLEAEKTGQREQIADLRSQVDNITGQAMSEQARLDQALRDKATALDKREKVLQQMQTIREANDKKITDIQFKIFEVVGSFAEDDLKIEMRDGSIVVLLFDKIMFNKGQTQIRSRGKEALKALAGVLAMYPEMSITVQGHSSTRGKYKDALALSAMRATIVTRSLTNAYGLSPVSLTAAGKGDMEPRFDEAQNPENQRTEIIVSPRFQEIYRVLKRSNF